MENSEVSNQLLKKKYDLHKSPEVESSAQRTLGRIGESVPQDPLARIENYLNRFREITDREDPAKREHGIEALKRLILPKFVTTFEDIPESYWVSQERIIRERGQQGDLNRFSDDEKLRWKKELSEGLLDDQRASLEQWVDYLTSSDSSYMPDAMKYWVFRSVTQLQEYDKEQKKFPERSKGTVKLFPDINHEALAYVIDAVVKKQEGNAFDFGQFSHDLSSEAKETFQKHLAQENFAKLYAWANEQIQPIPEHLLPITDGEWVTYEQDHDGTENYKRLHQSISGRGTGWCIAGENTVKSYLSQGDMHLFYTRDDAGNSTIPRVAIRMEGSSIAEVRGISFKQNLDPYIAPIVEKKLEEFPDGKAYQKKVADMKYLTEIERKAQADIPLSATDLTFLYEVDSPIQGFGYSRDPRIEELRNQRNLEEDMPVVFGCEPSQIAHNPGELRPDTRAYMGPLVSGIFDRLQEHNIEHVYTSFPEGKIRRQQIEIGGKTREQLQQELKQNGVNVSSYAEDMMKSPDFATLPVAQMLDTIRLKVGDLGLSGYPTTDQVYKKAQELGLDLCPAEVGPQMRLQTKDQPLGDYYWIGMKQITDSGGDPGVFGMGRYEGGLWLGDYWARPDDRWGPDDGFVFRLRKFESQNPQTLGFFDRFFKR